MSRIKIFINPFDAEGEYTEYEDVTEFVDASSISALKRSIDSTEYDVGVVKVNSISLKLVNETGKFSDIDSLRSMFAYKRSDSLVKITWDQNDFSQNCGSLHAGQGLLSEADSITVFEGVLNDEGTAQNIKDQKISFKVFGLEYFLQRMLVPYYDISNGQDLEAILYLMLNQAPFNNLILVDQANINTGNNETVDDKTDLENAVVFDVLQEILLAANSVMYIKDNVVYVSARVPTVDTKYTFYGEASNSGIENIESINNYRNGLHRVFNHWTWSDTAQVALDSSSVDLFGARSKEVSLAMITTSSKQLTILEGLRSEFSPRKQEMDLTVKINAERLALEILDKVDIDYPAIAYSADGEVIPLYGIARWGYFKYPLDESSFTLTTLTKFKIIAISYNLKSEKITFKLREV